MRLLLITLLFGLPLTALAQDAPPTGADPVTTYEVKRRDQEKPDLPSLRFLRANRAFLRAQLDRLLLETTRTTDGRAQLIDPRWLRLQEMSAAITAARDTVADEEAVALERDLLASVAGLADLEAQLDLMESLVDAQSTRLSALETDFLGAQETALVVLLQTGPDSVPASVVLDEDGTRLRVDLTLAERTALAQGGVAQIHHQLVEPREHLFDVMFLGAAGDTLATATVPVTAARDQLTFLELDLDETAAAAPTVAVWRR